MEPPLTVRLRELIAADGDSIPFADFMRECLYHLRHGYYTNGRQVIGRGGDFYTSVSTGALFGRLLADGFYQTWRELGQPREWQIVEQGADRGALAADVLRRLRELDDAAWRGCQYIIVEPSPVLQAAQRQTLTVSGAVEKLRQVASLSALPERSVRGVFFSNELADAFPVRCVKFSGGAWHEQRVGWDADRQRFVWREKLCDAELLHEVKAWDIPAVENYCAEISTELATWVETAAARLSAGIFLTLDYGGTRDELYTAARHHGTLRGYRHHQQTRDLLAAPGEQDLTAHVNFSQLILSGERAGLRVKEYTDQQRYLINLGRLSFFNEMERSPSAPLLREYQTLTHPSLLGASFKALTMTV